MESLQAVLLIASGLVMLVTVVLGKRLASLEALTPVQAFTAFALLVTGVSWLIRGPTRMFHGPPLVVVALAGVSYGAVVGGACLAFPAQTPRAVHALAGTFCVAAGVLLLLFQLRIIKPM